MGSGESKTVLVNVIQKHGPISLFVRHIPCWCAQAGGCRCIRALKAKKGQLYWLEEVLSASLR